MYNVAFIDRWSKTLTNHATENIIYKMRTTREQINTYLIQLMNGDDCIKEFIDYSRGYMQFIAYKYSVDKSLVEDVVFLAYDRILQSVHNFDKSQNGSAWIAKITQNEAYKLNGGEVTKDVALDDYKSTATVSWFGEDDRLRKYDIERAIMRLDEEERLIIEYKIFIGMTIRETAEIMNMPKSTVAYIFKQALKKLQKYLE